MTDQLAPSGWAVAVSTTRLGGGEPMLVLYAARIPDRAEAVERVKASFLSDVGDEITNTYPLSDESLDAIGYQRGDCGIL